MHQLIRCIVYAENKEDAVAEAKHKLRNLTRERRPYDYFVTFDHEKGDHTVAGKDRWGDVPAAVEADSENGQELIEEGWQAQKEKYERAISEIEEFFEENDDYSELIDGSHDDLIRHKMFQLGCYRGFPIFFYDNYGQGVQTRDHLDRALEAPNSENQKVWIVPADVHF